MPLIFYRNFTNIDRFL